MINQITEEIQNALKAANPTRKDMGTLISIVQDTLSLSGEGANPKEISRIIISKLTQTN